MVKVLIKLMPIYLNYQLLNHGLILKAIMKVNITINPAHHYNVNNNKPVTNIVSL